MVAGLRDGFKVARRGEWRYSGLHASGAGDRGERSLSGGRRWGGLGRSVGKCKRDDFKRRCSNRGAGTSRDLFMIRSDRQVSKSTCFRAAHTY